MNVDEMAFSLPVVEKIDYDLQDNEVEDYAICKEDYKISFIRKKELKNEN